MCVVVGGAMQSSFLSICTIYQEGEQSKYNSERNSRYCICVKVLHLRIAADRGDDYKNQNPKERPILCWCVLVGRHNHRFAWIPICEY
jgi:hypothetical protein